MWESAADAEMPALPDGGARFKFTAMIQEEHGRPIYNLQCNTCDLRHHELFATVGSNRVRDASCVACAPAACLRGLRGGANPSPRSNPVDGSVRHGHTQLRARWTHGSQTRTRCGTKDDTVSQPSNP